MAFPPGTPILLPPKMALNFGLPNSLSPSSQAWDPNWPPAVQTKELLS
jgi:hypothetical protein